jgi:haloalkane dehalogenase
MQRRTFMIQAGLATGALAVARFLPGCSAAAPRSSTMSTLKDVSVLGSRMAYRESGRGKVVVFLHGNPTSSFLWRNVTPHVTGVRALAPDLIGMGASEKPDIPYRFEDHAKYLDAWFEELDLSSVVLVGHDWGGALAMDWATRHPARVRGIALLETILRPTRWDEWPPPAAQFFKMLRSPGVGEKLVIDDNAFIERALPAGVNRHLTDAEMSEYRRPFEDPRSRRPLLQFPRELPIEGEPADVVARVDAYDAWLRSSSDVPKLLLTFGTEGVLGSPAMVDWARRSIGALEIEDLGPAGHHAPEDRPDAIGVAIHRWLERHALS